MPPQKPEIGSGRRNQNAPAAISISTEAVPRRDFLLSASSEKVRIALAGRTSFGVISFDALPSARENACVCNNFEGIEMPTGTVKWFNATKGYGFIQPSDGSKDAFVHISAVERAGLNSLREGQKVEYEMVPGRNGKSAAENLVVLD